MPDRIEVRRLDAAELPAQLDALARVLHDCVSGGASVSYMTPFSHEQARRFAVAYAGLTLLGLMLAVPYWRLLGLL